MSDKVVLTINIDGAARGNPGPAAFGIYLVPQGGAPLEIKERLGIATNNVAEYTALVRALHQAVEMGAAEVHIRSDSELLVKQMNGQYRVKNENIRPLYEEAVDLRRRIPSVRISHVYREQNRDADRLCNEALDELGPAPAKVRREKKTAAAPSSAAEAAVATVEPWERLTALLAEEIQTLEGTPMGPLKAQSIAARITGQIKELGFQPPK